LRALASTSDRVTLTAEGPAGSGEPEWQRYAAPGGQVFAAAPATATAGIWKFTVTWRSGREAVERFAVRVPGPGEDTLTVVWEGLRLELPPEQGYGPRWIALEKGTGPAKPGIAEPELEAVSEVYELGPWAAPFRGRIRAGLRVPTGVSGDGVSLYARSGKAWSYEGSSLEAGHVSGGFGNLEALALFRDTIPPSVSVLHPRGSAVVSARPRIEILISDTGAGVTASTLSLTIDGEPVIAEWDPESGRLKGHVWDKLPPGRYRLEVVASDRAGNTARASAYLVVG